MQVTSEYANLYADNTGKLKILDFNAMQDGYATKYSGTDLSPKHPLYTRLPQCLKGAFLTPLETTYQHGKLLQFMTGTLLEPLRTHIKTPKDQTLVQNMMSVIMACIQNGGNDASISLGTPQQTVNIKNNLNTFLVAIGNNIFQSKIDEKWQNMTPAEKKMMAYGFGRFAMAGVLGYHNDSGNQANELFYTLSRHCFAKIAQEAPGSLPDGFITELNSGICIQVLTGKFNNKNPSVPQLFQRNM